MKPLKKQLRPVAWLLAIMMIFQSCTVYKSTPITLEQAVQKESKVRIITNSNKTFVYKKIIVDEGKYYGVDRIKGKKINIPVNQDLVKSINEKNETLSTVLSFGIPLVIIGAIVVIAAQNVGVGFSY